MRTADFDYPLPQGLIAQTPVEPRDHSRLLVLDRSTGAITHRRHFSEIAEYLRRGDVLVFNDTRVIPARLHGHRAGTGGAVELLLLQRLEPGVWRCLAKPARRMRPGAHLVLEGNGATLEARVAEAEPEGVRIVHMEDERALEQAGVVPLPPYIHQPLADSERYQTVYARVPGSAAAPTAGLHFTPELLDRLKAMGVEFAFTTLHVGPGTFRPVATEDPRDHKLEREFFTLGREAAEAINRAKSEGRRIICVGTTSVRLLETAVTWSLPNHKPACLERSQRVEGCPPLRAATGWTGLLILPGHRFRVADALITNFHLPRSSLLMLVSAFAGQEPVLRAYQEAINLRYRFYSFGDAMIIL